MSVYDQQCLYSVVQNTSGGTRKFGFLPPHGVELASNEEFTVFGNILEALTRDFRATSRRHHIAFTAAINRGDLKILSTPSPILEDATTGEPKTLTITGGTLAVADPCWLTSDSQSESGDAGVAPGETPA
jgi:hypothetical protein